MRHRLLKLTSLSVALIVVLVGFARPALAQPSESAPPTSFVLLGPNGTRIVRVLTLADHCPDLIVSGRPMAMQIRSPAGEAALRPTRSSPQDSVPSVFHRTTCEATLPRAVRRASLAGRNLPLPPAIVRRIVVIGDTGCRLKQSDNAYQACNDAAAYPFARIAAAAARWHPDLVVHVGDYHYRENACPQANAGCAGSPWGYGSDTWDADFFTPGQPLLEAAPWIFVRGNHESCNRGGQGFRRFLDAFPLTADRTCDLAANDAVADYTETFAVPLGGDTQMIVLDSSNTTNQPLAAGDVRLARYQRAYGEIERLSDGARYNILGLHHPLFGFGAFPDSTGVINLAGGNRGLASAFSPHNPNIVPTNIDIVLSGHIHLWQQVGYVADRPTQFISGFSGTLEDIVPLPATLPDGFTPSPGAVVSSLSSWIDRFGFMTMVRTGHGRWRVEVHDWDGRVVNTCRVMGSHSQCDRAQVPR